MAMLATNDRMTGRFDAALHHPHPSVGAQENNQSNQMA